MEQTRGIPMLVAVFAVLAAVQGPRLLEKAAAPKAEEPRPQAEASGSVPGARPASSDGPVAAEPLRLLRDFLGLAPAAAPGSPEDLAQVVREAEGASHRLEALVALVPDPMDSNLAVNFDQAIESIQAACVDQGYLLDRLWLPWTGKEAAAHAYRERPGVLLLRRQAGAQGRARLLVVLLVGETLKQGVHQPALAAALDLAARLTRQPAPEPGAASEPAAEPVAAAATQPAAEPAAGPVTPVRLLGPSFSGSVTSLQLTLRRFVDGRTDAGPAIRLVSGSATASDETFAALTAAYAFERTVMDDERLQDGAFGFLVNRLGWSPEKIALLTEADTQYGQGTHETLAQGRGLKLPLVPFPTGLSSLRSAWDEGQRQQGAEAEKRNPLKAPRTSLELSLADRSEPADIAPQFSSLSAAGKDLALSNVLDSLWRSGVRYVGIQSSDVRDKLFLARRIRSFSPDMVLFTLDNNLLYAHPQYSGELDGTLVFSSFPLTGAAALGGGYQRQFASDFQEGVFRATAKLLGKPVSPPRGWIAVVSNGALWPLASFPGAELPGDGGAAAGDARVAPAQSPAPPGAGFGAASAGRGDLQILLLAAVLGLLALWLHAIYPPGELFEGTRSADPTARRLLAFGAGVLAVLGAVLVVLGTLPNWATGLGLRSGNAADALFELFYLAGLGAAYGWLLWTGAAVTSPVAGPARERDRRRRRNRLAWALGGLLLPVALAPLLLRLWMPGGAELFFLRGRHLTSGLSPLVSLGMLGGAFYAWTLLELKRRLLVARHLIGWPLRWPVEPPLTGTQEIAGPVCALVRRTFPSPGPPGALGAALPAAAQGRWFWIALAVGTVPPVVMLLRIVQPIAESRSYGQVFLLLAVGAFVLAAVSFHQFFALWLNLDRLLGRLDNTRLLDAFRRIAKVVSWNPMRGFGWRLPSFQMLALSAERLSALGSPVIQQRLREYLDDLYQANLAGDLGGEMRARRRLDVLFAEACRALAPRSDEPAVEELFALRVVAFLRPVVAHMRNCLAAALLATLFVLFAVRTYSFQPQWYISVGLWVALGLGVVVILWIFVQMDRNSTLSAIGNSTPGQVSFDRHFYMNVLTYGVLPAVSILVTQFPEIGRALTAWLNPVLRVAGVG